MRDELVSRELAVLLKEKGFDWKCNKCFEFLEGSPLNDGVEKTTNSLVNWNAHWRLASLPTQSLAQRWFREVHNITVEVWYSNADSAWAVDVWTIDPICEIGSEEVYYKTYELALEAGLMKAVKEVNHES